jgi:hypothetical protein
VRLSGENATYQAAVRQILQQKGLQNPTVKLSQVLRVDLDPVDVVLDGLCGKFSFAAI